MSMPDYIVPKSPYGVLILDGVGHAVNLDEWTTGPFNQLPPVCGTSKVMCDRDNGSRVTCTDCMGIIA
jgi:hypothetical protein